MPVSFDPTPFNLQGCDFLLIALLSHHSWRASRNRHSRAVSAAKNPTAIPPSRD